MPIEPSPAASSPDDFDRQLRDITSGTAGAARFRELSAAERAKLARPRGRGLRARWASLLRARRLRRPVSSPSPKRPPGRFSRRKLHLVGDQGRSAPGTRRQRLISAAKAVAILAAFALLLLVLHLLGFGPQ